MKNTEIAQTAKEILNLLEAKNVMDNEFIKQILKIALQIHCPNQTVIAANSFY